MPAAWAYASAAHARVVSLAALTTASSAITTAAAVRGTRGQIHKAVAPIISTAMAIGSAIATTGAETGCAENGHNTRIVAPE